MKKENAYDFRKKLLTVHESDVRDYSKAVPEDALLLKDGLIIEIGTTDNAVIQTAAADFVDFFAVSMGIQATLSQTGEHSGANVVRIALAEDTGADLGEAAGYKGFLIEINEGIRVHGYDDRGAAQALFYMEDLMCMEHAPYLKKGEIRKKPMFAPQMIHSGYGMEEWPDEYLMRVAHEGRDALLVFTKDVNMTRVGYLDFNDLIARAAKFGLDVYAYSFLRSEVHPDEEGAEEYYEGTYGKLFRECPGLAGVTLVGEAVEFRSKDPHVSRFRSMDTNNKEVPTGKPWPGWYPCEDMPKWLALVQKVIYKYNSKAEIVLWTYNWGFQPEDARVKLIENLPEGIALESTFEMFESWKVGDAIIGGSDYSLAFAGPGKYFSSEAAAAKKRGLRLYTMSQCAGVTWDFGTIPFEPMPYQWMKRYEAMRKAKEDWGLCAGMDCHHHGFYPSIITKFSKHAFLEPAEPMDAILDRILVGEYGAENLEKVQEGLRLWSEAITYYTPTEGDLCGASRVGPSYPFTLFARVQLPFVEKAMFGARVVGLSYSTGYSYPEFMGADPREHVLTLRIREERKSLEKMLQLLKDGIAVLEAIPNPNEKLQSIINLGKFIACCVTTNIHAKTWHILKCQLNAEFDKDGILAILDEMEALLHTEIANAEAAIPLVEVDSRLGWEPSMLYLTDKEHLEWKIKQVHYVLDVEMVKFRKAVLL